MKILFSGDLHLGRCSSRLPQGADRRDFSCSSTWDAIVNLAINCDAGLVLLSGDIVDENDKFFDAIGPLERGLQKLIEHEIRTLAVAGNHDFDVLSRLADALDPAKFLLLGQNGRWQRETITENGQPLLYVDGWSFPNQYVKDTPILEYSFEPDAGIPTLVLVHGELDKPDSFYAPLSLLQMRQFDVTGWLIGHIHIPHYEEAPNQPFVLNPGSPQAMDPGETGRHGPWIIELGEDGTVSCDQVPLSSARYESMTIDLSEVKDEVEFEQHVLSQLRSRSKEIISDSGKQLRMLSYRITFTGQTPLHGKLRHLADNITGDRDLGTGSVAVLVDKVDIEVMPEIDLARLAEGSDPPALLARLLLALEDQHSCDKYANLMKHVRDNINKLHTGNAYPVISSDPAPSDEALRLYLRQQAKALLGALRKQVGIP